MVHRYIIRTDDIFAYIRDGTVACQIFWKWSQIVLQWSTLYAMVSALKSVSNRRRYNAIYQLIFLFCGVYRGVSYFMLCYAIHAIVLHTRRIDNCSFIWWNKFNEENMSDVTVSISLKILRWKQQRVEHKQMENRFVLSSAWLKLELNKTWMPLLALHSMQYTNGTHYLLYSQYSIFTPLPRRYFWYSSCVTHVQWTV